MRGQDEKGQETMFSYVRPEDRVGGRHPLRAIRRMTDKALRDLTGEFDKLYAQMGRPSIAPEKLLRALLLLEEISRESFSSGWWRKPRRRG